MVEDLPDRNVQKPSCPEVWKRWETAGLFSSGMWETGGFSWGVGASSLSSGVNFRDRQHRSGPHGVHARNTPCQHCARKINTCQHTKAIP